MEPVQQPGIAASVVPALRYVLGTTFVASDLLAYAGGTLAAVIVDRLAMRSDTRSTNARV